MTTNSVSHMRRLCTLTVLFPIAFTFSSFSAFGEEECCGSEQLQHDQECCDGKPYNPNPLNPQTASFDITDVVDKIKGVFPKKVCEPESGTVQFEYTQEDVELCCDGEIKKLKRISGKADIEAVSLDCDLPGPGSIPGLASYGANVGGGFDIGAEGAYEPKCEDEDQCLTLDLSVNVHGGAYGEIVDESILRISATLGAELSATPITWCKTEGLTVGDMGSISITGDFTLSFINFLDHTWSATLFSTEENS